MKQKEIEEIIIDYDFACMTAEIYKDYTLSQLYELYDILGYHCYNFYKDNNNNLFNMKIGNLTLTYSKECGGIDKTIQVRRENYEWTDTTIQDLKNELKITKGEYKMTQLEQKINEFYIEKNCEPSLKELKDFIYDNQFAIARDFDRQCHMEDIKTEIDYMKQEGIITEDFTEEELDLLLEDYEEKLGDSEEWHYILRDLIYRRVKQGGKN